MSDQNGPRARKSRKLSGLQTFTSPQQEVQISWDAQAFDDAIKNQGVIVTHYRAMPDPSGMTDRGDIHASNADRESSDGFIYIKAGDVNVFFSNNGNNSQLMEFGNIDFATAYMTLPRHYIDCEEPVIVAPFDRFFLKDIEVRVVNFQRLEASSTGLDRLQYPATCVEHLIDANGISYKEGIDFKITAKGNIKWLTQNRPGWNADLQKGVVYSIRYRYTPYFVVKNIVHEIRVGNVTDPLTYDRKLERMPYQILVAREHVFKDTNRDPMKPTSEDARFQDAPPVGGNLGPK